MKKVFDYKNWYEDFKNKLMTNKIRIEKFEEEIIEEKKKLK